MNEISINLYTEPVVDSWGGYPERYSCGPKLSRSLACRFCQSEVMVEKCAFAVFDNHLASSHTSIRVCRSCGWWTLEGGYAEDDSGFESGANIEPEIARFEADSLDLPVRYLVNWLTRNSTFLHQIHPRKLEELVGAIFRDYLDCQVEMTKQTRDGGKDLVCCDSIRGKFVVEIKRYAPGRNVGVALVQRLTGVAYENGVRSGVFVTTSDYH